VIDKLDWRFDKSIPGKAVRKRAEILGYPCNERYLKGAGRCLEVKSGHCRLYGKLGASEQVLKVISVPTEAGEMKRFLSFLELIFDPQALAQSRITRLDVAFDIQISFAVVEQGLTVRKKGKNSRQRFHSRITGETFGERDEMIRIYVKLPGFRGAIC
jgi:hypothetical protein